jgi:hypothetical protein
MRLINIDTMKMEEFHGSEIPEYFILSHTWDAQGETSFQDYLWLDRHDEAISQGVLSEMTPKQRERAEAKAQSIRSQAGFKKIERLAALARGARAKLKKSPTGYRILWSSNVNHVWIDTACINKESSAELSEAINSMFAWYRDAAACFAYIGDCDSGADLAKGRWFTRGWTLQELLAPKEVIFFSASWTAMGTRTTLASTISTITKIQPDYLLDRDHIPTATVARRMSWASNRSTTREEDMAYCLLGIFGINMPLLYGEGHRAFIRLQEEIIRHDNDHTIFCWSWLTAQDPESYPEWSGCLAPQPSVFANSGHFVQAYLDEGKEPYEFQLTNAGLRINAVVLECLRETYKLVVFNAMESQPGGIQPRLVCVVVQSTLRGDIYLTRSCFPNRLLTLPYSHGAFGSPEARRTVYLVHERDPNALFRKRPFTIQPVSSGFLIRPPLHSVAAPSWLSISLSANKNLRYPDTRRNVVLPAQPCRHAFPLSRSLQPSLGRNSTARAR